MEENSRIVSESVELKKNTHEEMKDSDIKLYKRRWYILMIFSYVNLVQSLIGNTWGPLAQSAMFLFKWPPWNIALLQDWAMIFMVLLMPIFSWLMDEKGMRLSMMITSLCVSVGSLLRVLDLRNPAASWLIHAAAILNSFAGPVTTAAPPVISSLWFPPDQRTTATAIAGLFGVVGAALSFIIGPLFVKYRDVTCTENMTICQELNITDCINISTCSDYKARLRGEFQAFLSLEAALGILCTILVLAYFPDAPPKPPSASAASDRMKFIEGVKTLVRNKAMWLVSLSYAIPAGFSTGILLVLDLILAPLGMNENRVGWLGFYSILTAVLGSLLFGLMSDRIRAHHKIFIISSDIIMLITSLVFALIVNGIIPFSLGTIYGTFLAGALFTGGVFPLMMELVCEVGYPVAECVSNGLLTMVSSFFGIIILSTLLIPNTGYAWLTGMPPAALLISIAILLSTSIQYGRLDIDSAAQQEELSNMKEDNVNYNTLPKNQ